MNNILNHANSPSPFQNYTKQQLPLSRKTQNSISHAKSNPNNKFSLQQLYKQQLDNFIFDKQEQKNKQREREQRQKLQYQQRTIQSMQNQRMKDVAYKNYYKMLMEDQQHNKQTYISPFEQKQKLKESHIQKSIQQEVRRSQNWQYQLRKRQIQRKNQYKEQLMRQMDDRKKRLDQNKKILSMQNQFYRKNINVPSQIASYERQKKREDMERYRQDLDRALTDKLSRSRQNSHSQPRNLVLSDQYHNPLINPLPYNIQNPYILRQMQKDQVTPTLNRQQQAYKGQSYFAKKGNNIFN